MENAWLCTSYKTTPRFFSTGPLAWGYPIGHCRSRVRLHLGGFVHFCAARGCLLPSGSVLPLITVALDFAELSVLVCEEIRVVSTMAFSAEFYVREGMNLHFPVLGAVDAGVAKSVVGNIRSVWVSHML